METLLFVLDGVLVAAICFMAMKDDRRSRGASATSLFRYKETLGARPTPARRFVPGPHHRPEFGQDRPGGRRR